MENNETHENNEKIEKIEDTEKNIDDLKKPAKEKRKNDDSWKYVDTDMDGGVTSEKYDMKVKYPRVSELDINLKEKDNIFVEYTFNGKEATEGLKLFQKETIYRRNYIYTGVLLLLMCLYLFYILKDPSQFMSSFLCILCLVVIGFIWYYPYNHIKKTAKAADLHEHFFKMNIYDNCIEVGEDNGSFIISYNSEITKIYETQNLFMICTGKERLFILPKRCLQDEEETKKIREIFKVAMKNNFQNR